MNESTGNLHIQHDGHDVLIGIKAVPGASRDEIAGLIGDRLKVRITAPPEGGKANKSICALIAKKLGIKPRDVVIESGQASAEKTLRIADVSNTDLYRLISS